MTRWIVVICGNGEPETYGNSAQPNKYFTSSEERLLEARKIFQRKRQITSGSFNPVTDSIFWLDFSEDRPMMGTFVNTELDGVRAAYEDGECPDCREPIPEDAGEGDECANCHHVFWGDHHHDHDVGGEG